MYKGYDFCFKRFGICHDRCAMKVGTDGVLLGAWARGGRRVLDVGCGSGLIALMMAQRCDGATVVGVELDKAAALQAQENVARSPFADSIEVKCADIRQYAESISSEAGTFDAVVCNPPFYPHAFHQDDMARAMARESGWLSLPSLCNVASRVLTQQGELSVVLPIERRMEMLAAATDANLCVSRECRVRTKPSGEVKRVLLALRKVYTEHVHVEEHSLTDAGGGRSEWYNALTADFYL